ncbi:hypothetical protein LEP1GSC058_1819 [Leptospira fainei serovar Hurstbridge str. BUT 6]|uniref:Cysteine rich repeat domain protein n=1 Tax=Leptospira fainei serovar Hurstbridge str. BUT 6 TaxID=1193011 RepID=S3UWB9_9LEPT|nr:hypothetical protein [Leptospira fainei]EPG74701.1 hypothetical protein LEP1GSC058_1819 [Leptospira fainei serovar Hurstbridge str. BUT 6]
MNFFFKIFPLLVFLALIRSANAQTPPPDESKNPCATDRQAYCKNIPHGPRLHDCFRENDSKLSVACKSHLAEMHARHEAAKQACASDEQKFCSDSVQGSGGPIGCLRNHEAELSAACKAALPPARR